MTTVQSRFEWIEDDIEVEPPPPAQFYNPHHDARGKFARGDSGGTHAITTGERVRLRQDAQRAADARLEAFWADKEGLRAPHEEIQRRIEQLGDPGDIALSDGNQAIYDRLKAKGLSIGLYADTIAPTVEENILKNIEASFDVARKAGVTDNPRIVVYDKTYEGRREVMAETVMVGKGLIMVNGTNTYWKYGQDSISPGWLSTREPTHPIVHELGHVEMTGKVIGSPLFWRSAGASVSGYAQSSPHEFVAEVFAGMVHGKSYPMEVMTAYREAGGPEVKPPKKMSEWSEIFDRVMTWSQIFQFYNPAHDAKGRFAHSSSPKTKTLADQTREAKHSLAAEGVTIEGMTANLEKVMSRVSDSARVEGMEWYSQDAQNFAIGLSRQTRGRLDMQACAAITAAVSPQLRWSLPLKKDGTPDRRMDNKKAAEAVIAISEHRFGTHLEVNAASVKAFYEPKFKEAAARFRRGDLSREDYLGTLKRYGKEISDARKDYGVHNVDTAPAELIAKWHPARRGVMVGNFAKAIEISRGKNPNNPEVLSGSKVRSFWDNIVNPGTSRSVTIDTHMLRAMLNKPNMTEKQAQHLISGPGRYEVLAQSVRVAARKAGVTPNQLQAIVWTQWRDEHPDTGRATTTRTVRSVSQKTGYDKATVTEFIEAMAGFAGGGV
jgi:hypothetical protein